MKILIIEDKPKHILSAEKFAKECGHEVVIINNYDDANKALKPEGTGGLGFLTRVLKPLDYDMVMTDLFLPASHDNLTDEVYKKFEVIEQPYGLALALRAIEQGVKKVGIITDGNHHTNPMINALDWFRGKRMVGNTLFIVEQMYGAALNEPKNWSKLFDELNR